MADDLKIRVPVELDTSKVKDGLPKLNNVLANDSNAHAKIIGELDLSKTQSKIQAQLVTIGKNLKLDIGSLSTGSVQNTMKTVEKQVNNSVKNIKYGIQDIDTTLANTFKAAFNFDGQLDIVKTIENAKKSLSQFGTPVFSWNKDSSGEVSKITAEVTSLTGQIETLKYVLNETKGSFDYLSGSSSEKGILKLISDIDKAKSKYTTMLSEFKSSNSGIESGLTSEINAVNTAIENLGSGGSIAEVDRLFNSLKATANEIKTNLDTTSSSFNKVTNAENTLAKMPATIQEIANNFSKLKDQPNDIKDIIDELGVKLQQVKQVENQFGRNKQWSETYRDLVVSVKNAETQIKNLQLLEKSDNSEAQQQAHYYQKMYSEIQQVNKLKKQLVNASELESKEIKRQITNLEKRISYDEKQLEKKKLITNELERQKNELRNIGAEELKLVNARASDRSNKISATTDNSVAKLTENLQTLEDKWKNSPIYNDEFKNKFNELQTILNNVGGNPQALQEYNVQLNQLVNELNRAKIAHNNTFASEKANQNIVKIKQNIQKLIYTIQSYQQANSKAMKTVTGEDSQYKIATDNMISSLKKLLNASDKTASQLKISFDQIDRSFRSSQEEIKAFGKSGLSFFDNLKEKVSKFAGWMTMTFSVSYLASSVRDSITELKELDTILTEISKTSDRTDANLEKLGDSAFSTASSLGRKATDYLSGVQEAARAGFNEKESEDMAELSILAQSAGDMTSDLANQYLIATNAAYEYDGNIEKLNAALDSQNYITNHNALNMTDLAEATKIAASQSKTAGIQIDEMTAAVGTMIATTQQGGDIAGRAFKGLIMNLQQVEGTAEEIGDGGDAITTESLTKYEKACKDLGVSLKEVKDGTLQLRDPMQVLNDLAESVSKESEGSIKVANLINSVGGKYRGNQLNALLQNWDMYKKMLTEYNSDDAIGSAMQEAEKTANSWEGQISRLSNSWTKFIKNFANTDMIKGGISYLSDGVNILDEIIDKFGVLGTLIPTITAGLTFKNVGKQIKMPVYVLSQNYKYIECNTF